VSSRKTRSLPNRSSIKGNQHRVVERTSSAHVNKYGKVKTGYLSEVGAIAAATRLGEVRRSPAPGTYRCSTCGLWHLGGTAPTVAGES
jgi:hypothetical protein